MQVLFVRIYNCYSIQPKAVRNPHGSQSDDSPHRLCLYTRGAEQETAVPRDQGHLYLMQLESTKVLLHRQIVMADGKEKEFKTCTRCSYVMVWIAAASLGGSLAFHFSTALFNPRTRLFSSRYMIDIKTAIEGFSTVMCDNVTVRGSSFQAFRLEESPTPAPENYKFNLSFSSSDILPAIQSYYLPVGSEITVTMCLEKSVEDNRSVNILAFKGDDTYNAWVRDKADSSHAYKHSVVSEACNNESILRVKPTEADNYYTVIYNWPHIPQSVKYKAIYDVSLLRYDLSDAELMCDYNTRPCHVPLDFNTDQNIVLLFANESTRGDIGSSCVLRAPMWAVMFGVLPGILALVFTIPCFIVRCSNKMRNKRELQEMKPNKVV